MNQNDKLSNTQVRELIKKHGIAIALFDYIDEKNIMDDELIKPIRNAKKHLAKIYNILSQE